MWTWLWNAWSVVTDFFFLLLAFYLSLSIFLFFFPSKALSFHPVLCVFPLCCRCLCFILSPAGFLYCRSCGWSDVSLLWIPNSPMLFTSSFFVCENQKDIWLIWTILDKGWLGNTELVLDSTVSTAQCGYTYELKVLLRIDLNTINIKYIYHSILQWSHCISWWYFNIYLSPLEINTYVCITLMLTFSAGSNTM